MIAFGMKVHGNKGKIHSAEWRRKLSESQTGSKNSFFGKFHSVENKQKISEAHKGRIVSETTKQKMRLSCNAGKFKTGIIPWNKGRTGIYSEKIRLKISKALTGKHPSKETRLKMSLSGKGRRFTKEHCEKISQAQKGEKSYWYGKSPSSEHRRKISEANKGRHPSAETRRKLSNANGKERHHNWQGGISFIPYTTDWTDTLRRSIRERDNYTCQLCGALQGDYAFSIHHIDYRKTNCDPENLITLCKKCHGKTGYDKIGWQLYFENRRKNL